MKNGADFAVFVNTAQEFDGSDSGEARLVRAPGAGPAQHAMAAAGQRQSRGDEGVVPAPCQGPAVACVPSAAWLSLLLPTLLLLPLVQARGPTRPCRGARSGRMQSR